MTSSTNTILVASVWVDKESGKEVPKTKKRGDLTREHRSYYQRQHGRQTIRSGDEITLHGKTYRWDDPKDLWSQVQGLQLYGTQISQT